ncbi:MAG: methyl-accepting chemotaxis protein, partial [Pseudomonadales bacterium]|nr:methyl-accepting chemotaxis protein [Pseudomonadales bacterium]
MAARFIRDLVTSRLLLPVFLILIVAGVVQLMTNQWMSRSEIVELTAAVEVALDKGLKRTGQEFTAARSDVEESLQDMRAQTSKDLTEQLKLQLKTQQNQIAENLKKTIVEETRALAEVVAALAAPLIWDRDIPKLTDLVERVDAREAIVFAAFFDQYNQRLTRYVNREDPFVLQLMEAGEGRGAIEKVLSASESNPDVVVVTVDIKPQGETIGQFKVGLSTASVKAEMEQLAHQFDITVSNSAEAVTWILDQQTGKVTSRLQRLLADVENAAKVENEGMMVSINSNVEHLSSKLLWFSIASSVGLILFVAVLLGFGVLEKIRQLSQAIWQIAEGDADLTRRVEITGKNEITHMADGVNQFIGRIQNIIGQINTGTETAVQESAAQSNASKKAVQVVQQQRDEIDQVSSAVVELGASIDQVADHIRQVADSENSIH